MSKRGLQLNDLQSCYEDHQLSLYNFALRWVFNPAQAEELVQEAFVRVWNGKENVDPERLKSFLFKTLQNLCINCLRREKIWKTIQQLDPVSGIFLEDQESILLKDEKILLLKSKIEKIPVKYRKILLLYYYGDFSYQEISEILNISEGTVASRKSRALNLLKLDFLQEPGYAI